jgi:hypothetical protein
MILLASGGRANDEIAAALSIGGDVVSLWRKRFFQQRLGLPRGIGRTPREAVRPLWAHDRHWAVSPLGHPGHDPVLVPRGPTRLLTPVGQPSEIYFSILQSQALTPNDFCSLADVEARLLGFQRYYESIVTPFAWRFTKDDLAALMQKLEFHAAALAAVA